MAADRAPRSCTPRRPPAGRSCFDRTKERLNHGKELFLRSLRQCNGKGGRVTLNIAVSEPHKASLLPSFNKELCPLCYENLMAAIAEALSKPNQVPAARLVQADVGTLIDSPGTGGAIKDTRERMAWHGGAAGPRSQSRHRERPSLKKFVSD
jgi:hypothetical protein